MKKGLESLCLSDRATVAKIVHEYIKNVLGEEDIESIEHAKALADIYECRICAGHIAQVYEKGIMDAKDGHFGLHELVTEEEAELILRRIEDESLRFSFGGAESEQDCPGHDNLSDRYLRLTDIADKVCDKARGKVIVVDVRSEREYLEAHYEGAINIPITRIAIHPRGVAEDINTRVIFLCKGGVQSKIAAEYALEAGFSDIYYSAYDSN